MFESREEAGDLLALKLKKIVGDPSLRSGQGFIIVPLLRGGIILGKRISDYFNLPLRPLAIKKIGAPLNPELAIGAVAFDKTSYFDRDFLHELNVSGDYQKEILENKYQEAKLLQEKVEEKTREISWQGKNVIVVDDGIATGATAICASLYLRKQKVKKIILATPVIAKDRLNNIKKYFDGVISLQIVNSLSSISEFYEYFPQVDTDEVLGLI